MSEFDDFVKYFGLQEYVKRVGEEKAREIFELPDEELRKLIEDEEVDG